MAINKMPMLRSKNQKARSTEEGYVARSDDDHDEEKKYSKVDLSIVCISCPKLNCNAET